MTRLLFDEFSKNLLEGLLASGGTVQQGYTIASEVKEIDILFQPDPSKIHTLSGLGLLSRIAAHFCLIEVYRNPVSPANIRACLNRATEVELLQNREAKRSKTPQQPVVVPNLWILSPTASEALLAGFKAEPQPQWGQGIYFLGDSLQVAIVVLHQLPATLDTMWLRLMGRGRVQTQAIAELLALSTSEAFRKVSLQHLAKLQLTMKTRTRKLSKTDQALLDNLDPVYDAWEQETIQKGIERGRQEERQQMLSRTVPVLLQAGLSIDQIAQQLQVEVEAIRKAAE